MELIFAKYAMRYAAQGFHVFPLSPNSKVPTPGSKGVLDATTYPGLLAEMSKQFPDGNIGIATGAQSKITVVDVDPLHHGFETERGFRKEGKCWPNTPVSRTRSGGRHLFFAYHPGLTTGTNRIGQGIDIRNDGGYVVAPPSVVDGRKYSWLNWCDGYFAPVPQWTIDYFEADQREREEALAEKAKDTVRVDPAKLRAVEKRRYEGLGESSLKRLTARLERKSKPGRNVELYTVCGFMKPYVEVGAVRESDVRSAFEAACHRNGLIRENGIIDVRKTMNRAFLVSTDQLPDLSKLEDRPFTRRAA